MAKVLAGKDKLGKKLTLKELKSVYGGSGQSYPQCPKNSCTVKETKIEDKKD